MTDLRELLQSAEPRIEPGFDAEDVGRRVQVRARRRTLLRTAATAAVVVAIVVGAGPVSTLRRPPDGVVLSQPTEATPFVGSWVSTDTDGSSQTMDIVRTAGDGYEVVLRDQVASVACQGGPATLAGSGRLEADGLLVIDQPELTCDDGSVPPLGLPPQEELAGYALVLDAAADRFVDPFGVEWRRAGSPERPTVPPSPGPVVARPSTSPTTATSGGMWPQSTPEEVRVAQELADAGDPAATWQLDAALAADGEPWEAEIFTRFIAEELGWESFVSGSHFSFYGYAGGGGSYEGISFIRCAAGRTNPLASRYTEIPSEIRDCAPTIDERTYETVQFAASQPQRRHPSGIWVISRWELLGAEPSFAPSLFEITHPDFAGRQVEQVPPPSDTEVDAVLEAFLQARVDGSGAEPHLFRESPGSPFEDEELPLLYARTTGAPYERFEADRLRGPVWPTGWLEYELRLVADDGTVVEQLVHVVRRDEQLGLVYGHSDEPIATREDGEPLISRQHVLGLLSVTAPPLIGYFRDGFLEADLPGGGILTMTYAPRIDCGGPDPADAAALARQLGEVPELQATDPEPVRLAGRDWLLVDLAFDEEPPGGECALWANLPVGDPGWRTRVYLIDRPASPQAPSLTMLMIAVTGPEGEFEQVLETASPILDSLELDVG